MRGMTSLRAERTVRTKRWELVGGALESTKTQPASACIASHVKETCIAFRVQGWLERDGMHKGGRTKHIDRAVVC